MSTPDYEAAEAAREDFRRAEDALNSVRVSAGDVSSNEKAPAPGLADEASLKLDRASERASSAVDGAVAVTAAAVTRAQAASARHPRTTLVLIGAITLASLLLLALRRRL